MGREKFMELVNEFRGVCDDCRLTDLTVYGTTGYGKSHLLAAHVCLLAAGETKVVYVPDCRAFVRNPVWYMRVAMLFAWADDLSEQRTISTLDSLDSMAQFLELRSGVVFVIDHLSALEKEKYDNNYTI